MLVYITMYFGTGKIRSFTASHYLGAPANCLRNDLPIRTHFYIGLPWVWKARPVTNVTEKFIHLLVNLKS